jgi:hypothetical protein
MADTKISALPTATTPLAGTEILPIVQSGATVKVANNDLRPKQIQSNATSGVLQVAGPATAATRVMTTPDANFTVARTDAAQSFTGNQTLTTGNLIIGTSGQGIDFSATPGTGTSELLADYEEGTWTPSVSSTVGSITLLGPVSGTYTKIGRRVFVNFSVEITTNGTGAGSVRVSGLPYTISGFGSGSGRENGVNGYMIQTLGFNTATLFDILTYLGLYPGGSGYKLEGFIEYNT